MENKMRKLNRFLGLDIYLDKDRFIVKGLFWTVIGKTYQEAINNTEHILMFGK